MINNKSALRSLLVVAFLALAGCGVSQSGQPASAVPSIGEARTNQSSSAQFTDTSISTTTNPPATTTTPAASQQSATSTVPLPTIDQPSEDGVYTGSGSGVVMVETPPDGSSVLTFSCPACTGPVKVVTNGYPPLIIDKVGPYSGEVLVNATDGQAMTLTVTADADWTASIVPLADHPTAQLATSGQGGDTIVVITDPATHLALAHEGEGEFSVVVYNTDGTSLTVHESGPYSDTVSVQSPAMSRSSPMASGRSPHRRFVGPVRERRCQGVLARVDHASSVSGLAEGATSRTPDQSPAA